MSRETVQLLRVPILVGMIAMLVVAALVLARMGRGSGEAEPLPTIVVGAPGGGINVSPTPTATPLSTPEPSSPAPSAEASSAPPTPSPTPVPAVDPRFTANVAACEAISGAECIDELERIRRRDDSFVALVTFDGAVAGDVLNAVLAGQGQAIEGGEYALPGSGRGYYYSTLFVADLPPGEYTLTAFRNGEAVASRNLRVDN